MHRIVRMALGLGTVAGLGYAAYSLLLTPQAKENLNKTVRQAMDLGRSMAGQKDAEEAQRREQEQLASNRAWIQEQWTNAGY